MKAPTTHSQRVGPTFEEIRNKDFLALLKSSPRTTLQIMGSQPQAPYPKWVYSPAGGWYCQPKNWKSNTLVCSFGLLLTCGVIWNYSSQREWRHNKPVGWIPSMLWNKKLKQEFQESKLSAE